MQCRFCKTNLEYEFIDLVNSPPSNSFLSFSQLNEPEVFFPLKVFVCHKCFLVQIDEYKKSQDIFDSEYVYFSSFSSSWLDHAKRYSEQISKRLSLSSRSRVVEIASNDGYLLKNFVTMGIPVLGIEPTKNTAAVAMEKGIDTITEFFGSGLAKELADKELTADLFIGNNVLAHVPDIVDLVKGMKIILKKDGVITMEFPHLLQLIENNQFDTIYHEHFSYLSLYAVKQIFDFQGLELFDVEEISTHGGSLRIYAKHKEFTGIRVEDSIQKLIEKEINKGITTISYYLSFAKKALLVKFELVRFLIEEKMKGKSIAAYGAAAKGNTLLNFAGVKSDIIDFVVDANPAKQDKFLPGSHIPVVSESVLKTRKPDYILILPWNLSNEIIEQLSYTKEWGSKFIIPVPTLQVK